MRTIQALLALIVLSTCAGAGSAQAQSSTTFTYQGYLENGGSPAMDAVDLRFILYDSESGGSQVGATVEKADVGLIDGVFTVDLDFGAAFDDGVIRYLEVAVRDGGSTGSYTTLSPREALRPAPMALTALSLPNVTVDSEGNVGIGTEAPSRPLTVNGAIESTTGGIVFPDGTNQSSAAAAPGSVWMLGGNSGTDPSAGDYLGTTDDSPLELHVNSTRAFRIEPAVNPSDDPQPNLIFGSPSNATLDEGYGVTISGGADNTGSNRFSTIGGGHINTSSSLYATVSGGVGNTASDRSASVSGGDSNTASGRGATVGGGYNNTASGSRATIGGGFDNTSGVRGTVGGGNQNSAMGDGATVAGGIGNAAVNSGSVGGGFGNAASGNYATVPGGDRNEARAPYSFSAGYVARVKPSHEGTFAWSDNSQSSADSLVSTAPHQFLIRAAGGVGIGTNAPDAQLHALNNEGGGLGTPTFRAENESTGSGIAGYFRTNGSDATMVLINREGGGPLLRGFGNDGGPRVIELANNGSTSFYDGSNRTVNIDAPTGTIRVDGTFISSGADYAERLPQRVASERIEAGDLVGVTGGQITKTTDGADRLMIVSTDPAILGNKDASGAAPVAFLGQVPVRVRGPVQVGDLLVASGANDGTARAVSARDWNPERDGPIAGRAWSAKAQPGLGTITASVGLPQTDVLTERLQRQQSRIDALERRLERLEALLPAASK